MSALKSFIVPESYIEAAIFDYLHLRKVFCWKNDSMGVFDPNRKVFRKNKNKNRINGVSDILGVLPDGRFLAIEVKSARGVASEDQEAFIVKVNQLGGVAFVARSVEEVREELDELLKGVK